METIELISSDKCFSCRACEQICPKKCIKMVENGEGFLYPNVEKSECISCGICFSHCPVNIGLKSNSFPKKFYALKQKNVAKLMQSSSGGLFSVLAESIINNNGVVFGASYDEDLKVKHISVYLKEELIKLKGSKYVTSNTENTYREVKDLLKDGKIVLYSGSPCQIAGLYSFLGTNPENLYTADIICHGVPSQKLFSKYLLWLGNKLDEKVVYYGFRDKDVNGWSCGGKIKAKTRTKTKIISGSTDPYFSSFIRGETHKMSCYTCPFTSVKNRPADISMGDFWGIELFYPKFKSQNGVSCCIVNTEKGDVLFDKVKNDVEYIEVSEVSVCKHNEQLKAPSYKPKKRDTVYEGIDTLPLDKFIRKLYAPYGIRIKRFLISLVPQSIKICVKKILNK